MWNNVERKSLLSEPVENYSLNILLPSALQSFIINFRSSFRCLANSFNVLLHSYSSLNFLQPYQVAAFSKKINNFKINSELPASDTVGD